MKDDLRKLVYFFRELADAIENEKLAPNELISAGEIFMHSKFNTVNGLQHEIEEKAFKKFLFTGWYIHNQIELNEQISTHKLKLDD
jgi:hypothetical protein